jgi:DNA-binding Xre family transcriptional regulator
MGVYRAKRPALELALWLFGSEKPAVFSCRRGGVYKKQGAAAKQRQKDSLTGGEQIKEESSLSKICLTLKEKLEECGITRYRLSKMTEIQYQTIDRYYKNKITKIDSYILGRFCGALHCPVSDLLRFVSEEEEE